MAEGAAVQLALVGDVDEADRDSFRQWLHDEPGLSGAVVFSPLGTTPEELAPTSLVVSLVSDSVIKAFVRTLVAWLSTRRRGITIEVTSTGGQTVEIQAAQVHTEHDIRRILTGVLGELFLGRVGGPGTARGDVVADVVQGQADGFNVRPRPSIGADASGQQDVTADVASSMLPVTIYLSDESIHEQVEATVEDLLAAAGLRIENRDDPVIGSWFRRMRAVAEKFARSPAGREAALVAAHAAETRLVLAQDADVTAKLLQNLGPVIAALNSSDKDAVIRVGAILIVKMSGVLTVFQLTAKQQLLLNHSPQLATSPDRIIEALGPAPIGEGDGPPALC
ncbi:hypothetical protein MF672_038065 [Actinomadura sp. ATCC 31491]|uniref:Uncharacterized protein n=1 Tax=Actinomadura luzonensis TaxID=2805427 RepID=A0ABT0G4N1_9ACTN|nr:hypothetical protein [Actinomadura luzonensis]MCK2219559.1 hypothetical protein [Actinomadura luzonensis]